MDYHVDRIELEPQFTAVVRGEVAHDGIGEFLGEVFTEVMSVLSAQGLAPGGPPFACYEQVGDRFRVAAGVPVSTPVTPSGRVEEDTLPGGPTIRVQHRGQYEAVAGAYHVAEAWLDGSDWESAGMPWEVYLDDPGVPEPRTLVHWPIRPT